MEENRNENLNEKLEYSLKTDYKNKIIQIVEKIKSERTLKRIYKIVSYLFINETGG